MKTLVHYRNINGAPCTLVLYCGMAEAIARFEAQGFDASQAAFESYDPFFA